MSEDSSFGEEIQCSKGLFLCSAADAASTMDYSKGVDINEGVVDSPPSRGPHPTSMKSPSPLRTQTWTPGGRDRSPSPPQHKPNTCQTPQRKLYGSSVVEGLAGLKALGVPQSERIGDSTPKTSMARKVWRTPPSCPSVLIGKRPQPEDGVGRFHSSVPPKACNGFRNVRRQSLPRAPLGSDGGIAYRYSRRDDIMRGLENLRNGSRSQN